MGRNRLRIATVALAKNPNNEPRILTPEEAREYFDGAVREGLGITTEEFLARREEFRDNPNFDFIMFLLPLVEECPETETKPHRIPKTSWKSSKLRFKCVRLFSTRNELD